jgi:hypothetical protein
MRRARAELMQIKCYRGGTVVVLDTPYFVKTDTNGVFRLGGLPAGRFKLKAWIDDKISYEQPVELKPGAPVRVNFRGP